MTSNKDTLSVRAGIDADPQYGAVTPPLYLSSNFTFEDFAKPRKYDYSRSGNPTHEIAAKQQNGFGAMFSFCLNLDKACLKTFVHNLEYFSLAESLGGVESLICHPVTMTHAAMSPEALKEAGIGSNLLRLSVGIEDVNDLIDDLDYALGESQLKSLTASPVKEPAISSQP
ncbi:MAG: PLP-dependent transferase [Porticoccaceae bacterium]